MHTAPTTPTDKKWTVDVRVQPIDFSDVLPTGILVGAVPVTVTGPDSALVVTTVIRTGGKIVDVVYGGGNAGTYALLVDATGDSAIGGQTWKQRVKIPVIVQ